MSSNPQEETAGSQATKSDASSESAQAPSSALPSVIVDPALQGPDRVAATPSVIVDPSLSASVASAPATHSSEPLSASEASPGASAAGDDTRSNGDAFSEHDADRFADNLRPSWEMAPSEHPDHWSAGPVATPIPAAQGRTPTPRRAPISEPDDVPALVVRRGTNRRALVAAGGVVLLLVLVVWSMSSGPTPPPPSWDKTQTAVTSASTPVTAASAAKAPATSAPENAAPTPSAAAARPAPETVPSTPTAASDTPAPPVRDAPSPAATAKSVHLRVTTTPASAQLTLDGEVVPNPFDAWVARGGTHRVTASATGYVERGVDVVFDRDQTHALALQRAAVERAPARRTRRKASARSTTTRSRGAGFVTDNPY